MVEVVDVRLAVAEDEVITTPVRSAMKNLEDSVSMSAELPTVSARVKCAKHSRRSAP